MLRHKILSNVQLIRTVLIKCKYKQLTILNAIIFHAIRSYLLFFGNFARMREEGVSMVLKVTSIQEVFSCLVFSCLFEQIRNCLSYLFLIIFGNNKFTLVNLILRNAQPPRKYILTLFAGLKQSLKRSSQNLSV